MARQTRDPYQQARALQGLAASCHASGQHGQAHQYDQQARDIRGESGVSITGSTLS